MLIFKYNWFDQTLKDMEEYSKAHEWDNLTLYKINFFKINL